MRVQLTDQPEHKSLWWFVNQDGHCERCPEDPGVEVDLYPACSLVAMIYIERGDIARNARSTATGSR